MLLRSSTVSVKVSLKDINDNDPAFDRPSYTVTVSEATDTNATILTVKVSAHSVSKHQSSLGLLRTKHCYNIARVLALYKSYSASMNKIFIYARPCVNKMT